MQIDFTYFWKIFTSIAASFAVIVGFWEGIKKVKSNTKEAKEALEKKERREKALNTLADNIEVITCCQKSMMRAESMEQAIMAMLSYRVNQICLGVKEKGFIGLMEKIDLDHLYIAYENLGGNSTTHEIYEFTIKNYPVKDEI